MVSDLRAWIRTDHLSSYTPPPPHKTRPFLKEPPPNPRPSRSPPPLSILHALISPQPSMTSTPGLLRLKSTSSKISKPNKLKKKKPNTEPPAASSADSTATHPNSSNILGSSALLDIREKQPSKTAEELEAESDKEQQEPAVTKAHHNASDDEEGEATAVPKTEAELRYEERKRRRVSV